MQRVRLSALVLLAACRSEGAFSDIEPQLVIGPPLLDLGDVAVGAVVTGQVEVDHIGGPDGSIRSVDLVATSGADVFEYTGDDTVDVPRGDQVDLPITFSPLEPGYFVAHVTVVHDGLDSPAQLDIRGRAVVVDLVVDPLFLDFGAVRIGSAGARDLRVQNRGAEAVSLTGSFTSSLFSTTTAFPLEVPAGGARVVPLRFRPMDDLPATGALALRVASVDLPEVALQGNDCERGDPALYDGDGDGVTACGGDCDDADPNARPGGVEAALADGVDQDCDGLVDEGTSGYDDDGDGLSEDQGDCHDGRVDVNPTVAEVPANGVDDDCDGTVDSGSTDQDFDGFDPVTGGDCDDADPTVFPGAPEQPDGVDDDCDGAVDEGTTAYDDDGDGVTEVGGDCDDDDATTYPGAPEAPDWRDDDCDGTVDEGTVHADDDADGWSEDGGDCDDADAAVNPGRGNCP